MTTYGINGVVYQQSLMVFLTMVCFFSLHIVPSWLSAADILLSNASSL